MKTLQMWAAQNPGGTVEEFLQYKKQEEKHEAELKPNLIKWVTENKGKLFLKDDHNNKILYKIGELVKTNKKSPVLLVKVEMLTNLANHAGVTKGKATIKVSELPHPWQEEQAKNIWPVEDNPIVASMLEMLEKYNSYCWDTFRELTKPAEEVEEVEEVVEVKPITE